MTFSRTLMMTSVFALTAATPALADLTAEQVLEDQLKQMQAYGIAARASSQQKSGGTLIVDGLIAELATPEITMDMTLGGATFTEQSDGTVVVTYPDDIPVTLSGAAEDGEEFEMVMSLKQAGSRVVVSGSPDNIRYDFTADSFSIDGIEFTKPEEAAELDMDITMVMSGMSGVMELVGGGDVRDYTASFDFDSIVGAVSAAPDGEGSFSVDFEGNSIEAEYSGALAPQDLMSSFAQTIAAGSRTVGSAAHGPMTYSFSADTPDGSMESAFAVASGTIDFKMDEAGLDYGGTSQDMTASIGGSAIPFPPMTFEMAETGGRIAMPVVPSEDEQSFAVQMSMVGLELDPLLWGMFDPTGQLDREPATLVIDLDGDVILTEDIFDPAMAEQLTGPPGQINALNINEIKLSFAGAELTGDGDFAFNNEMGIPMPSGIVNLMLVGGNGLLDTLVNVGLLPEEQAMGARMMMGLFARPGDGEDTLVSTIEVQEDGSVLANGQRIR